MASYLSALGVLFQPMNFIMMYLCSLVGCVLGAILVFPAVLVSP